MVQHAAWQIDLVYVKGKIHLNVNFSLYAGIFKLQNDIRQNGQIH